MIKYYFSFLCVITLFFQPILQAGMAAYFPKNIEEMQSGFNHAKVESLKKILQIHFTPEGERTFENTPLAFDKAFIDFQIFCNTISLLSYVHPDQEMRTWAEKLILEASEHSISLFGSNKGIYEAVNNTPKTLLNSEREYYLKNLNASFISSGVLLSSEDLQQMKCLQNKINALCLEFMNNINQDESFMRLTEEEISIFSPQTFPKEGDCYLVPCNANTASILVKESPSASLRQYCYQVYRNRAFPQNWCVLKEIIELRQKLAQLLGYKNFAEMDISDQMAKTPEQVHTFIETLGNAQKEKIQTNWKLIVEDLPESVELDSNGKVKPWDAGYLLNAYSKKHFNLDQSKISEYFPFTFTFENLLAVFSEFFSLEFQIIPEIDLWDTSVITLAVKEEGNLIGHILFDLFPRKNKFTHACCCSIIPPIKKDNGTYEPALAVIIANLSSPHCFKFNDLKTLLHEFGHAMHALLGRSEMPSQAAYYTPMDFVEAPSQLLEEWAFDKEVLKRISRHRETGEPMPELMIDALNKNRNFGDGGSLATGGTGDHIASLLQLSLFSLKVYEGSDLDFFQLDKEIYQNSPQVIAHMETPYFCSIGHLTGYAAKYYCYAWSKQLALQMFDYIKTHGGPLDPTMGLRYRSKVIGKGGSQDSNELMADFLQ